MKKPRSLVALMASASVSLSVQIVRAQAQPEGRARNLFERGVADLQAGHFETACAALDESQALEPNLGTLIASGDCFERWGKPHSAALRYERFLEQVAPLNESERAYRKSQLEFVRAARARLKDKTPELILVPGEPRAEKLEVWLDQRPIEIDGAVQRLELDPGVYLLETRAAGRLPWQVTVQLAAGERRQLELAVGAAVASEAPPVPVAASLRERDLPAPPPPAPWRSVGWALGGLGLAGLGVGGVATALVLDTCPSFECGSDQAANDAGNLALVADIGAGVGIAGLVASAVILLANPSAPVTGAGWQPVVALSGEAAVLGVTRTW